MAAGFRQRRLADRLTAAQVQEIVAAFEAGTRRWRLAEQYNISVSSVGRVLQAHRQQLDGDAGDVHNPPRLMRQHDGVTERGGRPAWQVRTLR